MQMMTQRNERGFSLVELSIVLVILGLLTGGILGGQELIRAAELRSVGEDMKTYATAVYTFRDKYMATPGDMDNATRFWDAAHTTPSTCRTTIGTGTQTCDGDGDGEIDVNSTGSSERLRAWQHLANAGLINGNFTGVQDMSGGDGGGAIAGLNVPASKISPLMYSMTSGTGWTDAAQYFPNTISRQHIQIESRGPRALSPEELWNIDTKFDDGKPGTGSLYTYINSSTWSPGGCATTDDADTAEYGLNLDEKICAFYFDLGVRP
jgi:prepilin-type N-terminal cleavage/methylation domain-containing protein